METRRMLKDVCRLLHDEILRSAALSRALRKADPNLKAEIDEELAAGIDRFPFKYHRQDLDAKLETLAAIIELLTDSRESDV